MVKLESPDVLVSSRAFAFVRTSFFLRGQNCSDLYLRASSVGTKGFYCLYETVSSDKAYL